MTASMRAAVVGEFGRPLTIEELPVPEPGPGEIVVRVEATGLHVAAVDVHADKPALARRLGADLALDGREDPAGALQARLGGVHGVLVTAVATSAFEQAFGMLGPHGTLSLVGLPPGRFARPIFETVRKRITVRGSIVGTRQELEEALAFAGEGKVAARFSWDRLERGDIEGRVVLRMR